MNSYPIKMLLDEDKNPFFPLVTTDTIVENNTDKTAADLFNDRYTKEEVDKLFADLGTLQRLCGRVATYDDLPSNPKNGDTYIVGDGDSNDTEYMWIGDKWEQLGPLIDLSAYYTKDQVDGLINTLRTQLQENINVGNTNTLNTAKGYTDALKTTIGDNTNLNTADKSTLVAAINEVLTKVNQVLTDAKNYTDSKFAGYTLPRKYTITLNTDSWVDLRQTVDLESLATTDTIIVAPIPEDYDIYVDSEIMAMEQLENQIVFQCNTVPTYDVQVTVVVL